MTPPMYDATNIDIWIVKMSIYLKTLWMHVYLVTTKKSYLANDKYIEANAHTLSKDYLCMVSHCDSAFAVWNTLTSPELQTTNNVEKESSGEDCTRGKDTGSK